MKTLFGTRSKFMPKNEKIVVRDPADAKPHRRKRLSASATAAGIVDWVAAGVVTPIKVIKTAYL